MHYKITKPDKSVKGEIILPSSKSESNRALIIQELCSERFEIKNLSESSDTTSLKKYLDEIKNKNQLFQPIDIGNAGTAMRFLTAFLTITEGEWIITGSNRMKERPIGGLVNALKKLDANIEYMESQGYPPLKIRGEKLKGGQIEVDGSVSSQFISALLLIAPTLDFGLTVNIKGNLVSKPYVVMTIKMMQDFGVEVVWKNNSIQIAAQPYTTEKLPTDEKGNKYYLIDADWSAISYWYSFAALATHTDITLKGIKKKTIQGDVIVSPLFTFFGVKTEQVENGIRLSKLNSKEQCFGYDFSDNPDIAQTIAVTAFGLKIPCLMNGLETLKLKETDRVEALKNELEKLGAKVDSINEGGSGIIITPNNFIELSEFSIKTYNDHRMAMSFAPLALISNKVFIEDISVVRKSYNQFWEHLKSLGFKVEEVELPR